ncbi:MAG TPA: divalent-cation tolerance protein CutA [Roseiflexaceae bacterium]|nr:divalent-cation tolerance protein CutA [Roseiflexaceae bacterium]
MTQHLLILTGTSSRAEAQSIADAAVEQRLAAAVQIIGPVGSVYRWKSQLERTEEYLCLLKTSAELYAEVEQLIQSLHSYELPGIVALPIVGGSERYLEWYVQQLRRGG